MTAIRVVVADDEALVRAGFRAILESAGGIDVVGEAADGQAAVDLARALAPDLVLMDIRMGGVDGLEATRRLLRDPRPPQVLMLTTFGLDEYVYEAMKGGAAGFLLKDVPREQLVNAVRAVAAGETLVAPAIIRRLVDEFVRRPPPGTRHPPALNALSQREVQVLELVAKGLSNAEVADRLFLSQATVKTHVARTLAKLGLRDRVQAVVLAYESGLMRPGSGEAEPGQRPRR